MKSKKIIEDYLNFSGEHTPEDVQQFIDRIDNAGIAVNDQFYIAVYYIRGKLDAVKRAAGKAKRFEVEVKETREFFFRTFEGKDLGRISDYGTPPTPARNEKFWSEKLQNVFDKKQYREGPKIPKALKLTDTESVCNYFALRSFTFGNWVYSEQDRFNYLSGVGLALFDLAHLIGFTPEQMGFYGLLSFAVGARGSGEKTSHFEPGVFTINITRYPRPKGKNNDRLKLFFAGGGVGAVAFNFARALDHYAGKYIEPVKSGFISGDKSERSTTDEKLMKKKSIAGLMEKLMNGLMWNGENYSAFYQRLKDAGYTSYSYWRGGIFARAFEVYILAKMKAKGVKNIFLTMKEAEEHYPTQAEIKPVIKDFDALIKAIGSKITKARVKAA